MQTTKKPVSFKTPTKSKTIGKAISRENALKPQTTHKAQTTNIPTQVLKESSNKYAAMPLSLNGSSQKLVGDTHYPVKQESIEGPDSPLQLQVTP